MRGMKTHALTTCALSVLTGLFLAGCGQSESEATPDAPATAEAPAAPAAPAGPGAVTRERFVNADSEPEQWMGHGGTWKEQRFSALDQINDQNVDRLGLAWYAELGTLKGVTATPVIVDGVLYNTSAYSLTTAYNAATGELIWTYDPQVSAADARAACCGPSNRGVAVWNGKVFVGALDGRLIALDAATGTPVWETQTLIEGQPLSVTGAPRMAGNLVVIGNSGGDFGARGYFSAYDADTGEKAWRFYVVPGEPGVPDGEVSDPIMEMAAETWTGEWWTMGGGGNPWDGMAYDPELNLVYVATGNGSPHMIKFRSPGGGDNLFLCSIIAVDATTGEYRWHYQEVPAEQWDYDCTNPMILAELELDGVERSVIMHAPKPAYFYVIDRATGELLSAEHYVPNTNWSTHVDMETGRPVINPEALGSPTPMLLSPGTGGGHNWNPMSYSPLTGLAYIPAQETWQAYSVAEDGQFRFVLGRSTWGAGRADPELRRQLTQEAEAREKGFLLAWNPVTQTEAWRVPYPHAGSGGTMVTAGNLVVQGTIDKTIAIYRADNGDKLWEMNVDSVAIGGAASYMVDGKQYIAINTGWNSPPLAGLNENGVRFTWSPARLHVFALDATGVELPPPPTASELPAPPQVQIPDEQANEGAALFTANCQVCHGPNAIGGQKDLRFMTQETHDDFLNIVLQGTRAEQGMPSQGEILTTEEAEAIHAYLISRAQEDWQPGYVAQ